MFSKILIANRAEIACRVIRSARRLGIGTVAVYSEADSGALHTRMADEAVCIGPAAAVESYLNVDALLAAIAETGAEAVHPGYGFLSESAAFAEALAAEGVTFIGPPAGAIAAMGDKLAARRIAADAGVATIPGTEDAVDDAGEAIAAAREIGYPVMIKAAAGGGGKGMRLVWDEAHLREDMASAINEATSAFGDGRIFVERFIVDPRHIEIQVLADSAGTVVHLGERECSIQRRHQKVIEEAPSPLLDEETRAAMGAQACALAAAVGYRSAGTVEFVADQQRNFYFLEMNTRLQVEHPVTEMVTGVDLVEQQIRIAAGEHLAFGQADVTRNGWAMECRIYAEDPVRGFVPSIGRLSRYREPPASDACRVDAGVDEGSEISMYYDPMIAKLVTWGTDRPAATSAMQDALDRYELQGVAHNAGFLSAVVGHPRFAEGRLSTAFIEEEFGGGFDPAALSEEALAVLVPVAALVHAQACGPRRPHLGPDRGPGAAPAHGRLGGRSRRVPARRAAERERGRARRRSRRPQRSGLGRMAAPREPLRGHGGGQTPSRSRSPAGARRSRSAGGASRSRRGCGRRGPPSSPRPCRRRRRSTSRASCSRPCRGSWWRCLRARGTRCGRGSRSPSSMP